MSTHPPLHLTLDSESYARLRAEAELRELPIDKLLADLVHDHLREIDGAEEALRRLNDPQPAISPGEMRRLLAS